MRPALLFLLALLAFPASALAAHESTLASNPALRADYAFAVNYWHRDPHSVCPGGLRVEVRSWPWGTAGLGSTQAGPFGPHRYCEVWIRYGIGACTRRVVLTHELGHVFRLRFYPGAIVWEPLEGRYVEDHEHSPDPANIMYPAVGAWNHPEMCA